MAPRATAAFRLGSTAGGARALALSCAALIALGGCASDYRPQPAGRVFAGAPSLETPYRIGAGDELALRFLVNSDLNGPVVVGPDGVAIFPLIAGFPVAGMTPDQLNRVLTARYAAVLRNPQVQVLMTGFASSQIYVMGEVHQPGVFNMKGRLTVAQAVATAGGVLETARTGQIVILRQRPGEVEPMMRVVRLDDLFKRGVDNDPGPVLPGDLIFVPRSKIAEVDRIVDQYVNRTLPFSRSVGVGIGNVTY